jgi:DNA-binding Lrp family transcriptional regulator
LANEVVILVTVEAGKVGDSATAINKIEGVQKVLVVTGPYDIIVLAEIPQRSKFRRLVDEIHEAPGVGRTETCIAI